MLSVLYARAPLVVADDIVGTDVGTYDYEGYRYTYPHIYVGSPCVQVV